MKRHWKVTLWTGGVLLALVAVPIIVTETRCRAPIDGLSTGGYQARLADPKWRRDESRTWLTYPEWHIVYSAEELGRHLQSKPPSSYHYLRDIGGFWRGLCAVNRATAGAAQTDAKVMLYTIGTSFSAELLFKAAYENTIGRISELIGGYKSADDKLAAKVQQSYGAFMHETPWYEYPFSKALSDLWRTSEPKAKFRHWERRFALSSEYGVKTGYAKLIGFASGASLGRDERTLRFVVQGNGETLAGADPRFKVTGHLADGLTVLEAPRYAQFTDLLLKLANGNAELVEISGNDDIFLTIWLPPGKSTASLGKELFSIPLDEPRGWRRVGISTKVPKLLPAIRAIQRGGGKVEHVYDY
ncbi:hypothetical protein [Sphingomonas daechungensis]|uniref:hypothetical protein n=1 Tax=Sphingomonas daechungensis TaxID=1176646 RepID=UPI003783303E